MQKWMRRIDLAKVLALGRDTKGKKLTEEDLHELEDKKIATRWVGTRAVTYDGFPTFSHAYHEGNKISNARVTTHLSSGGVSFGPAAVAVSRSVLDHKSSLNVLTQNVLKYSNATRAANSPVKAIKAKPVANDAKPLLPKLTGNSASIWVPAGSNIPGFNRSAIENCEQRAKRFAVKR